VVKLAHWTRWAKFKTPTPNRLDHPRIAVERKTKMGSLREKLDGGSFSEVLCEGARSVHNQVRPISIFHHIWYSHALFSFNISLSMVTISTDGFLTMTLMRFAEVGALPLICEYFI
jgi:hypothetical protein